MSDAIHVAIDGPAGAGKSTVAKMVAGELGFIYVDTGAMYRALTWKVLNTGVSADDREAVIRICRGIHIELLPGEQEQKVRVDGTDITSRIRTPEVNRLVPVVSQIPEVREMMVKIQQEMAAGTAVVMDGRDIGSQVLPEAEVKIYMTASVEERAKRRYNEMKAKGENVDLNQLESEIAERDRLDRSRAESPLVQAEDAICLDTTHLSVSEAAQRIIDLCRQCMTRETTHRNH